MATDLILFPFFQILVETIFGSVGLSLAVIAGVIILILGLCRCSWTFISYWLFFYAMVVTSLYAGGIGVLLAFIIAITYMAIQMIRLLIQMSQ